MGDEHKIARLSSLWLSKQQRLITEEEAEAFLELWNAMKEIDREEAEEARVEHATKQSLGENWMRTQARYKPRHEES